MRRAFILVLLLALLPASRSEAKVDVNKADRSLAAIVRGDGPTDPLAGAAIAVRVGGKLVYSGAAGCAGFAADGATCLRPLTARTKMRMASISKMAVAFAIMTLVDEGRIDLDADASAYLGRPLRNPHYPEHPITVRQLLSHTSSIRDPEAYWAVAPAPFSAVLEDPAAFAAPAEADRSPGAWFSYANLNYGILAEIIERVADERFDTFSSRRVLAASGLDAGFNWSGVSAQARAEAATIHRLTDGAWRATVDGQETLSAEGPAFLADDGLDRAAFIAAYRPGDNPTLFSPQGGLRASVEDVARLAERLKRATAMTTPAWRFDPAAPNGDTDQGYFAAYGLGVQRVDGDGRLFDGVLEGHPGEAYGLFSGAWRLPAAPDKGRPADIVVAFAVTGTGERPPRSAHPSFNVVEARLMRLGLDIARSAKARPADDHHADDPRPFDPARNAMQDVDAALAAARASGRRPLLVLGGDWCHDSRGMAAKLETPTLSSLVAEAFELVYVDVGYRDRNLDVPRRFGVNELKGTPTLLILDADGRLLNAPSVHDWRNAASRSLEETEAYLRSFAPQTEDEPSVIPAINNE